MFEVGIRTHAPAQVLATSPAHLRKETTREFLNLE